ncbi:MAG: hypothetical protein JOZ82_04685 [Marmoricola sp.]|nr:hypothetical protein [Marmoricola sp.]
MQGEITPDFWHLSPEGSLWEHRTGDQPTGLDDTTLAKVRQLVDDTSRRAGVPVDMELAIADTRLWSLPARPVST